MSSWSNYIDSNVKSKFYSSVRLEMSTNENQSLRRALNALNVRISFLEESVRRLEYDASRERRERERERRQRLDLPPSYEEAQRLFLREARQTEWVFEPLPAPIPPIRRSSKKIIVVTAN